MIRIYISIALVVLVVLGIAIAINLVQSPKTFRPKAQVVGVNLSLQPENLNVSGGDKFTMDVFLDSANEQVSAIEIEVIYDYKMVRIDDIENTKVFTMELGKDLSSPGMAKLIVLAEPGNTDKKSGVVAKLKGTVLQNGNSEIGFSKNTRASAVGKLDDVLDAVSGAIVTAGGSGGQTDLQRRLDYMKDENRVNRALDEFYEKGGDQNPNNGDASGNAVVNFAKNIIESVKEFVGGVNKSVEDTAEGVIKK